MGLANRIGAVPHRLMSAVAGTGVKPHRVSHRLGFFSGKIHPAEKAEMYLKANANRRA